MLNSELVNKIMFDYSDYSIDEITNFVSKLPSKILRWLGANHPDNRIRKIFFQLTNVVIGEKTVLNSNLIISDDYKPLLVIGKRVAISPNVTIICSSGPNNSNLSQNEYVKNNLLSQKKIIIEDDVWIGTNVTILPGVTIGKGSIIGAGTIVSKNVSEGVIALGNHLKEIRTIIKKSK